MHFLQREVRDNETAGAVSRRALLRLVMQGSGALVLGAGAGVAVPSAATSITESGAATAKPGADLRFNAFLKITPDNKVTVVLKHLDMGQGVTTGLTALVAEELDASWDQVHFEFAPSDAKQYNNLFWGPAQGTGGSTSIANSWTQLRTAGAAARAMLVAAAAKKWQVPEARIQVSDGVVSAAHGNKNHRASFGELAADAAKMPVPEAPRLKSAQEFKLIGKRLPRKDSLDKTTGKAVYTQDMRLPGMLTAVVLYPPKLFAKLTAVDSAQAKAVPGVVAVVQIPRGAAVLAEGYWPAQKARALLQAKWDFSACETRSSATLFQDFAAAARADGTVAKSRGDAPAVLQAAQRRFDAEYHIQYLAHATMEPMNCVVYFTGSECDLWFGSQMPTSDQHETAAALGIPPEKVRVHTLYAGGSFGRRACPGDYVMDAVAIARQMPGRPVKMVWSREDDMRNGKFRPMAVHRVEAALDDRGRPSAWRHHAVAQPVLRGSPFEGFIQGPIEGTVVEGIEDTAYAIPNLLVRGTEMKAAVSTLWWRSVGHSGNAFVMETFIDRLAREAKADAVQFRRDLLAQEPRYLGVLNLAADKAGWGKSLAKNRGRGVAVHKAMGSWVAQVAEVTLGDDGSYKIDRVVCAIDCGLAVNPDVVAAQMEGSIGFALGQVLGEEITLKDGAVMQSNFTDYAVLRLADMPRVEVYIVPSAENPSGVGEPGVPPLAPAVANALTSATGKYFTRLPIGRKV